MFFTPGTVVAAASDSIRVVLRIDLSQSVGAAVVEVIGELDAYTVPEFRQELSDYLNLDRLVIDLRHATYVDADGLSAVINSVRRIRERGGDVALVCDRPPILKMLASRGFDRVVSVSPDVALAIEV